MKKLFLLASTSCTTNRRLFLIDEDIVAVLTKKVTSASEDQRGYMSKILNWKLSIYWLGECHVVACF